MVFTIVFHLCIGVLLVEPEAAMFPALTFNPGVKSCTFKHTFLLTRRPFEIFLNEKLILL